MNLLLDFIPLINEGAIGGAGSFTYAIIQNILERIRENDKLYAVIDTTLPTFERFDNHSMIEKYGIKLIDASRQRLSNVIAEESIDVFFISVGQWYAKYDLSDIHCKVIMFIHDIYDKERDDNCIDMMLHDSVRESPIEYMKRLVYLKFGRWKRMAEKCYGNIMKLYNSPQTIAYTVSDYSRASMEYYFPELKGKIRVCYSPMKEVEVNEIVDNAKLRSLIEGGKRYILMMAAHRTYKNAENVIKVYRRFVKDYPDVHLLTLRYGKSIDRRHIDIGFLSDSDLEHALKHASVLLFPSFFEGFGYPPIEAMKYGTPVVASNATSIPEITGGAAEMCSPFYPASIYIALCKAIENREKYRDQGIKRYLEISDVQKTHLELLMKEFGL